LVQIESKIAQFRFNSSTNKKGRNYCGYVLEMTGAGDGS
jgi:hypothetical protein